MTGVQTCALPISIYAGTNGFLDDLPVAVLGRFEQELFKFIEQKHPKVLSDIVEKKSIDDGMKAAMGKAIEEFKKRFVLDEKKGAPAAAAKPAPKAAAKPADDDEEEDDEDEEEDED